MAHRRRRRPVEQPRSRHCRSRHPVRTPCGLRDLVHQHRVRSMRRRRRRLSVTDTGRACPSVAAFAGAVADGGGGATATIPVVASPLLTHAERELRRMRRQLEANAHALSRELETKASVSSWLCTRAPRPPHAAPRDLPPPPAHRHRHRHRHSDDTQTPPHTQLRLLSRSLHVCKQLSERRRRRNAGASLGRVGQRVRAADQPPRGHLGHGGVGAGAGAGGSGSSARSNPCKRHPCSPPLPPFILVFLVGCTHPCAI
jgi:hypothetical protein